MGKGKKGRNKKGDGDSASGDDLNTGIADDLSDQHTIASTNGTSMLDADDFAQDYNDDIDTDDILIRRGGTNEDALLVAAENRLQTLQDVLTTLNEFQQEKRSAKRESILRKVFKTMCSCATGESGYDTTLQHYDNILAACTYALRQTSAEQYAACRVLEVMGVILGANEEEYVDTIDKVLRRTIQSAARPPAVRMAAFRTLATCVTVCAATDTHLGESIQELCELFGSEKEYKNHTIPTILRATAWDCWSLLATLQDNIHIAGQDDYSIGRGLVILDKLKDALYDSSPELRSAAGQCLSLIHEARLNLGVDVTVAANTTALQYEKGSWENTGQFEEVIDEVKQRVAELAVESGHHMSKKAKKEQRATFREYMSTIVDDESPTEIVNFRNTGSLELNSWKEIIQLNFIRHCLQSGFQIQLLTNPTLQSMFGLDGTKLNAIGGGTGMSQLEKRLVLSKTSEASKLADQDRRGRRDKRENIKNHFLTIDGDDI